MLDKHHYSSTVIWTGNKGVGTENYKSYGREFDIYINKKAIIKGSSDSAFRGDESKHNPEELLLASVSSCHMLWYLHLCSESGIVVLEYIDNSQGVMKEETDGSGRFISITLSPEVTIKDELYVEKAKVLHKKANEKCFIANSLNFPIFHNPIILIGFFD